MEQLARNENYDGEGQPPGKENMVEKTMTLQKRAIAFLSAVILAVSMTCVVPFAAYATDGGSGYSATLQATAEEVTVAIGDTIDLSEYFDRVGENSDNLANHIDYSVASTNDGGAATINKHSGILTPSAEGTVIVTAVLMDLEQPSGVNTNPCYPNNVVTTAYITVKITGNTGSYGFQGNDLQIQMTSFNPQVVSSSSTAYVNSLSSVSATDGYYCFVINQSYGTGSDFEEFLAVNDGNITLTRGQNANPVASLGDGSDVLILEGAARSNTVTVKISEADLTSGNYTLTFASDYQAGNGRTLGATISFTFSI